METGLRVVFRVADRDNVPDVGTLGETCVRVSVGGECKQVYVCECVYVESECGW